MVLALLGPSWLARDLGETLILLEAPLATPTQAATGILFAFLCGVVALVATLIVLFVAKLVLDARLRSWHHIDADKALTEADNPALARLYVGYYLGVFIAFMRGGLDVGEPWLGYVLQWAVAGGAAIILINVALFVCDLVLLNKVDDLAEVMAGNRAVANVWAGMAVATGLVIDGAFGGFHGSAWLPLWELLLIGLVWFAIGQALFIILFKLFELATPYDDKAELVRDTEAGRGNRAVGFELGLVLVAFGIIVRAAVGGAPTWVGFLHDLGAAILYAVLAMIMVAIVRVFSNWLFIRGGSVNKEIAQDANVGVGVLSGAMFVLFAIALTKAL
ncbi:MAG: DUF350 domain-containing protein [Proteobacteria bacterium]|nr:DUF350 domain-containing protein [Pseudomonadota bacterium]